jgi:hypothetical protein
VTTTADIRLRHIVEQTAVALTDAVREQLARTASAPRRRAPTLPETCCCLSKKM